ncbi:MAG: hypothetical protein WCR21_13870, partial [Bacteroidota bacterium]
MTRKFLIFFLGLGLFNAQIIAQIKSSININDSKNVNTETTENSFKTNYIQNQNYLSKSSLKYFGNDSLKGFDENKIRIELLSRGLSSNETHGYIEILKRQFINEKFALIKVLNESPSKPDNTSTTDAPIKPARNPRNVGGGAMISVSPCVNEGFEATPVGAYIGASNSLAVTGWTLSSRIANGSCPFSNWTNGATEFSIVSTPILNFPTIGTIPHSPLGGTVVARINNSTSNTSVNRLTQSFPVTNANALFQFAYCGYWQDGGNGHSCCDQPGVYFKMYSCSGTQLSCSSLSLAPGSGCQSTGTSYTVIPNTASWTNWQTKFVDLTPYIGTCITIEIYTTDCSFGGHFGTTFFDCLCGGNLLCPTCGIGGTNGAPVAGPVSFCAGSGVAQISAPLGYSSYQWIAPGGNTIAAPQGTMSTINITNPVPGSVYSVNLVSPSG